MRPTPLYLEKEAVAQEEHIKELINRQYTETIHE